QIEKMVADTKKLLEFQETPSTKEELLKIPMLNREDIKREVAPIYNTELKAGNTLLLHHNLSTNGIGYLNILFDTNQVPEALLPYMGILKSVLGYMDTENFKYGELFNEINIHSGGIYTSLSLYPNLKNKKDIKVAYEVKAKVLYSQMDFAFNMIKEILFSTKFDDEKRLYEIIAQLKSRLQMSLTSAGHSTAATRSMSYFSPVSYLSDLTGGISFYHLIEEIESDFDHKKEQLISNLKQLMYYIFRPENMMVSYTSEESGLHGMEHRIIDLEKSLYTKEVKKDTYTFPFAQLNEGFKTSSKVQYVARSGNFVSAGYEYTGALKILKVILSYEYLWTNIRVKGGAYGCMSGFNKLGDTYFVSYRDPNLEKTNEVFEGITDYIRNFQVDERDMVKYIIGTISDMDVPMNPSAKGSRSLGIYLTKQTFEDLQEERNQVLDADIHSIRELADLMEEVLKQNHLCVIGSEEKIEEQSKLFQTVEQLIR
ncbi:MAG TPA: insulinase family protein, partial [Candidatus Merdenecus merdavium]|nr:insulinase family protein [Candidatus Merdenecus merdavium]